MGRVLLVFVVLGWVGIRAQLEPEFTQRLDVEGEASEARLLELASWSREQGWEREALHALTLCVGRFPSSAQGHEMLHEELVDGRWLPAAVDPSTLRAPPVDLTTLDSRRRAALAAARARVFSMAQSSFIFDFWTDLDRGRVESYVQGMNPHYSKLKGFFRLSRTEAGAKVFLFSNRSEYLAFYTGVTEKSGEHTEGFFASLGGVRFLAFYDTPHDDEVLGVAKHEGTHLLMSQSLRGGKAPLWLDEGLACYFAGDADERSGGYVAACYLTARHALRSGTAPSFRELAETPAERFGFREYALAWSWVSFFMADPATASRLSKLLVELREMAETEAAAGWTAQDWERRGNEAFLRVVSPAADLEAGWKAFVEGELGPRSAGQCREAAGAALALVREPRAVEPPLDAEQRLALLREAEAWRLLAAKEADASGRLADGLLGVEAVLTRSIARDYDRDELASTLDQATRSLDALLADGIEPGSAPQIARLMRRLLLAQADARELDALRQLAGRAAAALPASAAADGADPVRELYLLRRRVGVTERLVELGRRAAGAAIVDDPLDLPSLLVLLELTLDHSPGELGVVLPHLVFQAQVDPDDVRLAALAACMASLGSPAYADALLSRACAITQDESTLEAWKEVVARHREGGATASHPATCPLCAGSSWLRCGRCEGDGRFDGVCRSCDGGRSIRCGACGGDEQLVCRHCGGAGKLELEALGETVECKVCDKGRLKCTLCRGSGEIGCPTCAGKGRVPRPCGACFSAGWAPCPGGRPPKPCHLCEDQGRMPCPGCLGQGHDAARCEECDGWGARLCERGCVAGRIVCADCSGTGRVYKIFIESNSKAGSNKCTTCSGRGYARCDACQATGFVDCPVQEPGRDCAQCQGTGKVTCAAGG